MANKEFGPLVSLASLGAGGIAVLSFVLMQYTIGHGSGLITRFQLWVNGLSMIGSGYYYFLESIMVVFTILHLLLTLYFGVKMFKWIKEKGLHDYLHNPLKKQHPILSFCVNDNYYNRFVF